MQAAPAVIHGPDVDGFDKSDVVDGDSHLSGAELDKDAEESRGRGIDSAQRRHTSKRVVLAKRSASDWTVSGCGQNQTSSANLTQLALHSKEEKILNNDPSIKSPSRSLLNPPRPVLHRSCSNSPNELRSRYHNATISSTTLQEQLIQQTKHLARSKRAAQMRAAKTHLYYSESESDDRALKWYSSIRSRSNPDLAKATTKLENPEVEKAPLKTCLKHKSKSATTSPPGEFFGNGNGDTGKMTLRRVKTVDFEETSKPLLSLQSLVGISNQVSTDRHSGVGIPAGGSKAKYKKRVHVMPSGPGSMSMQKSAPADPAITRADVHVIAITPSWESDYGPRSKADDAATPTIQTIESTNGCYEVIWDDMPAENNPRLKNRRSSSASHSLKAVSSTATRGLERVNSKLTDWSGTWNNNPSNTFKPTIIVFPDDHDDNIRTLGFEHAIPTDEDTIISVPPNSQRTSAAPSRISSRPTSAPISRTTSHKELSLEEALAQGPQETRLETYQLVVPNPTLIPTQTSTFPSPLPHTFSNIEDADLGFRGHRDSVAIAHTRFVRCGGISPDLLARNDSVSLARKRMFERNCAKSGEEMDLLSDGDDDEEEKGEEEEEEEERMPPLPTIKAHAIEALRKGSETMPILGQEQAKTRKHIQILD